MIQAHKLSHKSTTSVIWGAELWILYSNKSIFTLKPKSLPVSCKPPSHVHVAWRGKISCALLYDNHDLTKATYLCNTNPNFTVKQFHSIIENSNYNSSNTTIVMCILKYHDGCSLSRFPDVLLGPWMTFVYLEWNSIYQSVMCIWSDGLDQYFFDLNQIVFLPVFCLFLVCWQNRCGNAEKGAFWKMENHWYGKIGVQNEDIPFEST